ncbi:Root meristem growth factor 10 [Euphorbia peplus]|nr:Root meristem growth factor 10 [Euphorbia peplus]
MSFYTCSLFLLVLVCISLHASNARRLAGYESHAHDKFHVSVRNAEKSVSIAAEKMESSSKMEENDHKVLKSKDQKKGQESFGSVPWRVPHNKPEEKHPGFNLDYSPPKTHPPSHN